LLPKEKLFFKIPFPSKIFKTATAQATQKQLDNYSVKPSADSNYATSTDRRPAYNSGLAKVAVQCFV
jgi:hypothetical protein